MSLELCMIVKDSGDKIVSTLHSWKSVISYWTILDTGSTDNTKELIKKTLNGVPGTLYEEPNSNFYFDCFGDKEVYDKIVKLHGSPAFNFAKARNRALDLCKRNCDFIACIDDTYHLVGARDFQSKLGHLKSHHNSNAFVLDIRSFNVDGKPNSSAISLRIIKSSKQYRWEFPIHEILSIGTDTALNLTLGDDVYIKDIVDQYHAERSLQRFRKDIIVLDKCFQITEDIDLKARYAYHGVQTILILGNEEEIKFWLKRRIDTCSKTHVDLYHTLYMYSKYTGDTFYAQQAIEMYSNKLEAYYELATILFKKRLANSAFAYLKYAFDQTLHNADAIRYHSYHFAMQQMLINLAFHFGQGDIARRSIHYLQYVYGSTYNSELSQSIQICRELNVWRELDKNEFESQRKQIELKVNTSGKKIIAFITGPAITGPWDGNSLTVRGSETSVIKLAEKIAADHSDEYDVFVYCETPKYNLEENAERKINNVIYRDHMAFWEYIKSNAVDYVICVRTIEYFIRLTEYQETIRNYYFWCHDAAIPTSTIRYNQIAMRKFIFLTNFHQDLILNGMPIDKKYCAIIPNAIDIELLAKHKWPNKVANRFIYSSDANRGLYELVSLFPLIRKLLPNATLHIYCDLNKTDLECFPQEHQAEGKKKLQFIKDFTKHNYVKAHGRTDKISLYKGFAEAEYWFYPTGFIETFCITALEAQYFKCKIITSDLGALQETVVSGVKYKVGSTYQDVLKNLVSKTDWKLTLGHEHALKHSYDIIAEKWLKLLRDG